MTNMEDDEAEGALLLTPYRGSFVGGNFVGEESKNGEKRKRTHYVYFSQMQAIYCPEGLNEIIIVKSNQEVEKFIFENQEVKERCLESLSINYENNFKKSIRIQEVQPGMELIKASDFVLYT